VVEVTSPADSEAEEKHTKVSSAPLLSGLPDSQPKTLDLDPHALVDGEHLENLSETKRVMMSADLAHP
jgi:hypothetical protein